MCTSMWEEQSGAERSHKGITYSRLMTVQGIDVDAGTFGMTLVTEGETADGHIVSIEGGSLPTTIPLLVSHINDPKQAVGSIVKMRKHLGEKPPRISAIGEIELGGEGNVAAIRRDLMHMIGKGHIHAVSLSGAAIKGGVFKRSDLPISHPHFIDVMREPFGSPRRQGLYFHKWRALEGSVVAVGADPLALIARADETQDPVSTFWRSFAADLAAKSVEEPKSEPKPPEPAALLAAFGAQIRDMLERGLAFDDLVASLTENKPETPPDVVGLMQRIQELEARIQLSENRRVFGEPSAPLSGSGLLSSLRQLLAQDRVEGMAQFRALIEEQRGKVTA